LAEKSFKERFEELASGAREELAPSSDLSFRDRFAELAGPVTSEPTASPVNFRERFQALASGESGVDDDEIVDRFKEPSGYLDVPKNFLGEYKDIVAGIFQGGALLAKNLVTDPIGVVAGTPGFVWDMIDFQIHEYVDMFSNPLEYFREKPLSFALNVLPITGLLTKMIAPASKFAKAANLLNKAFDPLEFTGIKTAGRLAKKTPLGRQIVDSVHHNKLVGALRGSKQDMVDKAIKTIQPALEGLTPQQQASVIFAAEAWPLLKQMKQFKSTGDLLSHDTATKKLNKMLESTEFRDINDLRRQLVRMRREGKLPGKKSTKEATFRETLEFGGGPEPTPKGASIEPTIRDLELLADEVQRIMDINALEKVASRSPMLLDIGKPPTPEELTRATLKQAGFSSFDAVKKVMIEAQDVFEGVIGAMIRGVKGSTGHTIGMPNLAKIDVGQMIDLFHHQLVKKGGVDEVFRFQDDLFASVQNLGFSRVQRAQITSIANAIGDAAIVKEITERTGTPAKFIYHEALKETGTPADWLRGPKKKTIRQAVQRGRSPHGSPSRKLSVEMAKGAEEKFNIRLGRSRSVELAKRAKAATPRSASDAIKKVLATAKEDFTAKNIAEMEDLVKQIEFHEVDDALKWAYENFEFDEKVVSAVKAINEGLEPFTQFLRQTGQLTDEVIAIRKAIALQSSLGLTDNALLRVIADTGFNINDLTYIPHMWDTRLFGKGDLSKMLGFVDSVTKGKPMSSSVASDFAALKKNIGRNVSLEEAFTGANPEMFRAIYASSEKLSQMLQSWVSRQANFQLMQQSVTGIISDLKKQGRAIEIGVDDVMNVGDFDNPDIRFRMPNGEPMPKDWVVVPLEAVMRETARIFDGERLLIKTLQEGGDVGTFIERQIKKIQPAETVINDPEALVHMREFTGKIIDPDGTVRNVGAGLTAMPRRTFEAMAESVGWKRFERTGMSLAYDSVTNFWRMMTLQMSPRWVINNTIGNSVMSIMDGVTPADVRYWWKHRPEIAEQMGSAVRGGGITFKELGEVDDIIRVSDDRSRGILKRIQQPRPSQNPLTEKMSSLVPESWAGTLDKVFGWAPKTFRRWRDTVTNINIESEIAFREIRAVRAVREIAKEELKKQANANMSLEAMMGAVLADMKPGPMGSVSKTQLRVLEKVNQTLFDYSNMSNIEKSLMRRIFPFWSWHRNIFYAAANMPSRHPVKLNILNSLAQVGAPDIPDDLPEWLKGSALVGYDDDGNGIFLSMRGANPYFDAFTIAEGIPVLGGEPSKAAAMMNPFIKVAIEQVSGKDTFRQKPFTDDTSWTAYNGKTYKWDYQKGGPVETTPRPDLLTHVLRQFPEGSILEDAIAEYGFGISGPRVETAPIFAPRALRDTEGRVIDAKKLGQESERQRIKRGIR
jgi:hypothetical protein